MESDKYPPCPKSDDPVIMGLWKNLHKLCLARRDTVDPRRYCADIGPPDLRGYLVNAQLSALLKKLPSVPGATHKARMDATLEKWWAGEKQCLASNIRLRRLYSHAYNLCDEREQRIRDFLGDVKRIIRGWLGPVPDASDEDFGKDTILTDASLPNFRWGPGATFSDRGQLTTWADKLTSVPSLTFSAYMPFMFSVIGTMWGRQIASKGLSFVPGNRFATAPKTSRIYRAIASEPSGNIWLQLGYGGVIRRRLKSRASWDLTKAQEIHKQVACESSGSLEFATLDLSNASDTICTELVKLLLPRAWFDLLNSARSAFTVMPSKRRVLLEKFSSMGNGYTFELETLIFAALAVAFTRRAGFLGQLGVDVFVYGDDIIIRDELAEPFEKVLSFCGFTLNAEKSFWGPVPFRESCGGDYLSGRNVRPFYIDADLETPFDCVVLANKVSAWLDRYAEIVGNRPLAPWFHVLDCIPSGLRSVRGPRWLGDQVIHDRDPRRWQIRMRRRDVMCWKADPSDPTRPLLPNGSYRDQWPEIRVLYKKERKIRWHHWTPEVVMACAVLGYGDGREGVTPRSAPFSVVQKWERLSWESRLENPNEILQRWD